MPISSALLALAIGGVAPSVQEDPANAQLLLPARLVVDVSALLEEQDAVDANRTADRIDAEFRKHVADNFRFRFNAKGADAAVVTIRLSFYSYMESKYAISIEVDRPQGEDPPPIQYDCLGCLDEELIDGALEHADDVMALLETERASSSDPEPNDNTAQPPAEPNYESPRRGVLVAGYVSAGAGLGLLGGGIAAIVVDRRPLADAPALERNFRPLGIGLAAGGGAALIAGAILLATEYTRCKRRNTCVPQTDTSSTAIIPWLGSGVAGLGLHRRF